MSHSSFPAGALPVAGSVLGHIFQPLYQAMAWILAASYSLVPNYAVAIAFLTIVVMALTAPLTIKSTRSALAMQRLLPELKKLQQKYRDDRLRLQEEMLALYREHGVNPVSGLLPALIQIPAYVVLYGVIRGLTHTLHGGRTAAPLYVNHATALARSLHAHPGHLQAFGLNLASSLFSPHGSWPAALPYAALVLAAIALQWLQTRRMNGGPSSAESAPRSAPAIQRYLPLVFALIYLRLPAGVNVYVLISAACRLGIQEWALRPPHLGRPRLPGSGQSPSRLPWPRSSSPDPAPRRLPGTGRRFGVAPGSTARRSATRRSTPRVMSALVALVVAAALAATAVGAVGTSPASASASVPAPSPGHAATTPTGPSLTSFVSTAIPATPVGAQLRWILAVTVHPPAATQEAYDDHFDAAFRAQVSLAQLVSVFDELNGPTGMHLVGLTTATPTRLVGILRETRVELKITLSVDVSGQIDGLLFAAATAPPTSWSALRRQLATVAPDVSLAADRVRSDGQCQPVSTVAATTPRPLGSMFKLYVLGALAQQIRTHRLSWSQSLVLGAQVKSLGSGTLQNEPVGTTVSVDQAATAMISISDNTAADLLISVVGRSAVERQVSLWSSHANLDDPFLTTRELFILQYADYPTFADHYLRLDSAQRASYLTHTVDSVSLSRVSSASDPHDISTIEWFASADDICRAFAGLHTLSAKPGLSPLATILSVNDGGLRLNPTTWPTVWFKGGSEPGVLTLGYLARDNRGRTFVVTTLAESPHRPVDGAAILELQSLIRGSFALLR